MSFTQGLCVFQPTISSASPQNGETMPDNYIGFESVADRVGDGSLLRLRYRCSRPCRLLLKVVVSTLRKTDLVVFRRKWVCSMAPVYRVQQVRLRLPLPVLYQNSFIKRSVLDARNVTVCAWLAHYKESGTYHKSLSRICRVLQLKSSSRHPAKCSSVCLSWPAKLKWNKTRNLILQCPHESGQIIHHTISYEIYSALAKHCNGFCCFFTRVQAWLICWSFHWQVALRTLEWSADSNLLMTEIWRERVFVLWHDPGGFNTLIHIFVCKSLFWIQHKHKQPASDLLQKVFKKMILNLQVLMSYIQFLNLKTVSYHFW